jgi:hypothetical protein
MGKTNNIIKHANSDYIDADEVNQNLENVGAQGGLLPYDASTNNQDTNGDEDIGSLQHPFGHIYVNKDKSLKLIDPSVPEETEDIPFANFGNFSGDIRTTWLGDTPPNAGWLMCYGQQVNKTTYSGIWNNIKAGLIDGPATGTFTVTTATDRINITAHGLSDGDIITLSTTGTLPSGLTGNKTTYYIINSTTNDFQISTQLNGNSVPISDTGSGVHSYHIDFYIPDGRGRTAAGRDNIGGSSANRVTDAAADTLGGTMGADKHTLTTDEIPKLDVNIDNAGGGAVGEDALVVQESTMGDAQSTAVNVNSTESAHNNMQPTMFFNWIIKI